MSAAFAAHGPGSRVLLGWWRELLGYQPQQLWFGRLLLHRIEAAVRVIHSRSLDPWQQALLRLLSVRLPSAGGPEEHLADLHVDGQLLAQLVRELTATGLLYRNGTGRWDVSSTGRLALESGCLSVPSEERRTFVFVDNAPLHRPPHFFPLRRPVRADVGPVPENTSFVIANLEGCLHQSTDWKARYHFPAEVESLLTPQGEAAPAVPWQRVILDALESLSLVLLKTAGTAGKPAVLGFAVRAEGWILDTDPILTMAEGWEEVLPDLTAEPSPEAWRHAWQTWCQPRSLPRAEVEACRLEHAGHRLLVHAPPRLIERLRTTRSDAIKQEAWLLAGEGRLRPAAQIELVPLETHR